MENYNLDFSSIKTISNRIKVSKPLSEPTLISLQDSSFTRKYFDKSETLDESNFFSNVQGQKAPNPIQDKVAQPRQQKMTSYTLAKKFAERFYFKVFDEILHVWNGEKGYYIPLSNENADTFFRSNSPEEYKHFINSRNIKEIVSWIKSECKEILSTYDLLENRKYVIFNDGQYNLLTRQFTTTTSKSNTFSKLNANYNAHFSESEYFEKFVEDICCGDRNLYLRLQEFFGYVISEIRDLKLIFFMVGPKDSGKSIILKLLEYLIGPKFCANLNLEELNKQDYLNRLLAKKLNTCAEISEISLNRLDNLKKLSGGDRIMSKALYDQPVSFTNTAALVFAGNHLPETKKLDRSNAFADRLFIIPFVNQIPKDQQDPTLFEKLLHEIDYIASWALDGLIRLINNNYVFTETDRVKEIMDVYKLQSNSIEHFIKHNCIQQPNSKIFKEDLEKAYYAFCDENNVVASNKNELHKYIKSLHAISFKKVRIGVNTKNGYEGLTLKSEVT